MGRERHLTPLPGRGEPTHPERGIVAGQGLGGVIAKIWGITGPFWFAFAGSAVLLALLWRELAHVAHADEATLTA